MTDPIEPLQELVRRWRKSADELRNEPEFDGGFGYGREQDADELEFLLPALAQQIEEHERLAVAAALKTVAHNLFALGFNMKGDAAEHAFEDGPASKKQVERGDIFIDAAKEVEAYIPDSDRQALEARLEMTIVHTGQAIGWYRCDGKDCPICKDQKVVICPDCANGFHYNCEGEGCACFESTMSAHEAARGSK